MYTKFEDRNWNQFVANDMPCSLAKYYIAHLLSTVQICMLATPTYLHSQIFRFDQDFRKISVSFQKPRAAHYAFKLSLFLDRSRREGASREIHGRPQRLGLHCHVCTTERIWWRDNANGGSLLRSPRIKWHRGNLFFARRNMFARNSARFTRAKLQSSGAEIAAWLRNAPTPLAEELFNGNCIGRELLNRGKKPLNFHFTSPILSLLEIRRETREK